MPANRISEIRKRSVDLYHESAKRWASTRDARGEAQQEIAKKGPLLAESPSRARDFQKREVLRARVQLAEGLPRLALGQERVIGLTFDLHDLPSNEAAERAGHPVARLIETPEPGMEAHGFGTGFLVTPRLLMTNHHVFPTKASAAAAAHFGYEHDAKGLHSGTMFTLNPDTFFITDESLDFSLVAIEPRSFDGHSLQQFGCLPLIAATGKILMGQPVSIIQHPLGGPKQWAETENKLLFLSTEMPYMQYQTDTLPGSSGSPVYNSFWELVGLHHSGVPRMENGKIQTRKGQDWDENTMSDDEVDWIANEGVRVSCLVEFLRQQKPETPVAQDMLNELLISTADPLEKKAAKIAIEGGTLMPNTIPGPATINIVVNGNANFNMSGTVPTVTQTAPAAAPAPPSEPAALEKSLRFDPKYSLRTGYSADFLTGAHIPLPGVASKRVKELLPDAKGDPLVLKYHHISIAMNQERRLMMWSAANVDYSDAKRPVTGRKTFGADLWKADPRIPQEFQLEDAEFYEPAKKFDRGHIVRREDNAWGDSPTLQEFGNSDTFHWTNCTPQHQAFNRSNKEGLWGQLENHISDQASGVEGSKLSIFAGPVLADDDLEHDFGSGIVKIPIRFWKVIAVMQTVGAATRLAVFGFVLEQATTIQEKGLEAFQVGQFKTFQRSLADIAALTGVTFPAVLQNADAKKSRPGAKVLESLRDIEEV